MNMALTYPELIKVLVPVDAWGLFDKEGFPQQHAQIPSQRDKKRILYALKNVR
ncbi:MAG: hypothetical protein PHZ11_06140 [Desulfitobacteriaceae bacterium]|nr:hypothetical protein [Desulfitobacteriaceae bacterium]MDD4346463.1 hypothetical protein [Desulfitobacteriaceae bacterium]